MKTSSIFEERYLRSISSGSALCFSFFMASLVAAAIFQKSHSLPMAYRWSFASGMLLLCFFSFVLLSRLREYAKVLRWSALLASGVGVALFISIPLPAMKMETSSVTLPGHSESMAALPTPLTAWGRVVEGHTLHTAFPGSTTANSLVITLLPEPTFGTLLVTQPASALLTDEDTSTDGDGVAMSVKTFDERGIVNGIHAFALSQADFLERTWIELPLWRNEVVTRLELTVDSGPDGSTPAYDTTLIGLQVHSLEAYFNKLSNVLLLALSLLTAVFTGGYALRRMQSHKFQSQEFVSFGVQFVIVGVALIGYVFWQQTQSQFAYYWDYLNYWSKTEALYSMMQTQQWGNVFAEMVASLSENYSALPAVPMAVLTWFLGAVDRVSYALVLSLIYTTPTYFAVIFLAKRVIDITHNVQKGSVFRWDISFLCLVVIYPSYFGTTLLLMPDIGGVLIMSLAILVAADVVSIVERGGQLKNPVLGEGRLVAGSLALGAMLAVSFLFRRWYIFAFAGIFGAMACLTLVDFLKFKRHRWSIFAYSSSAVMVLLFSALSMLCWIIFSWGGEIEKHDYAALYASYNFGLAYSLGKLVQSFGLVPVALSVIGLFVGLKAKRSNNLIWILISSAVISVVLFLSIQTPGRHHFYLLMPVFSVGFLLALWTAVDRWGGLVSGALIGLILIGGVLAPRVLEARLFPDYRDLMPKQQLHGESLKEIAKWLDSSGVQDQSFCVIASSTSINQSMIANLWQLYPRLDRKSFPNRLIRIGEVDSQDGPPNDSIRECNIFLVAEPFQYHLSKSSQYNVELLQQELLSGRGLGEDVDRTPAGEWILGEDFRVLAYRRNRPTSAARYLELVERYRMGKALGSAAGKQ